jgi:serine/threonine protein kinase
MDDDGTPRLCDFGRSKFIDHRGFTTSFAGSARYMAPELTEAEADVNFDDEEAEIPESPPNLTKATDVFAFAMVALEVSDLACVQGFVCCC